MTSRARAYRQDLMTKTISRILIAHPRFPPLADDYADAFGKAGVEAKTFIIEDQVHWVSRYVFRRINKLARALRLVPRGHDLFRRHPLGEANHLATRLSEEVAAYEPDVVLCIHGKRAEIFRLRESKVVKIGWWVEQNNDWPELEAATRGFDFYFAFAPDVVDTITAHGREARYLPHGANVRQHYPIAGSAKEVDLVFVGAWSPWRDQVIASAFEVTQDIALYGHSWLKKSRLPRDVLRRIHKGELILGAQLNALHNKARVVLNADRTVRLGLNMRYFEVLASRSCLLTDNALDLHTYFTDNEHLCVYHDLEDMQRKLRSLLDNEDERLRISANGFREVTQHHTCDHRVQSMLAAIGPSR
ncbi:Glycosyl transferases group 1 [Paraburkholderia lycopersici]|uniref:Glycosyl transferases group 1 n=2 Tax=Paraburkholderia lycopersici TaxID=416944 RepID=A0A1G6NJQ4_9BURK|nr:Glycosyl transferases group 1 [Paraburkholderia lycopersici]